MLMQIRGETVLYNSTPKDGLPQAFAAFVMFGNCTLDEYSEFEFFASHHHGKATACIFSETAKKWAGCKEDQFTVAATEVLSSSDKP